MTIQTGNLGTAPSGAGGDTFRSFAAKMNENFTNNTHAASRLVGAATGNLMEVGAFGLGTAGQNISANTVKGNGFYQNSDVLDGGYQWGNYIEVNGGGGGGGGQIYFGSVESNLVYIRTRYANSWGALKLLRHSGNTTIDSNGFIKAASPVAQLFADKIAANEEALEHEPLFEKVDVGHYLLKNTEGFSDDGWYIEMPKDANGNVLVAVRYQQLEDNTIEVKTYAKKFDEETGDIIPNLEKPRDIPTGRWIDIRLKELPKPEIEISNTPADFQPTNLSQAVAEALKDDTEQ